MGGLRGEYRHFPRVVGVSASLCSGSDHSAVEELTFRFAVQSTIWRMRYSVGGGAKPGAPPPVFATGGSAQRREMGSVCWMRHVGHTRGKRAIASTGSPRRMADGGRRTAGRASGCRQAATLAMLMDRLQTLRTEVGSIRARSRLAGVGLRRNGDHLRNHVGQPLVLIDAKTLVHDVAT